ncbi:MAG: SusC/RagA family TonB-linked outer membrane protein [Chitinophagaceae bacterium]|nr:MAG: SusC/RagA family TonB-linked outer membrane protein [Chitinophagaceae bacterium]
MNFFIKAAEKLFLPKSLSLMLVLLFSAFLAMGQQRSINGTVRSQVSRAGISNATVSVKGTSRSVQTNENGSFIISAATNDVLLISSVGYVTREIKVGNGNEVNVQLQESVRDMDAVVVTALGIKREEKALGYSTTVVKGDELTSAISSNWTDALSGKVAGLNLVRSNSGPSGSNKIILRGENNLTGDNEALIVVDGVVINNGSGRRTAIGGESAYGTSSDNMPADYGGSLNDINPEDIESVTVLKGPAAAALYGERGANGAIMITTKTGSSKKKGLGITFNSNVNMEDVNRWPDLQYEYGQGTNGSPYYSFLAGPDGVSTSATSSAYGPRFNGQQFYQYDPVTGAQATERSLWRAYPNQTRDYFKTGTTLTNTVSIDGGTDKTTARFSVTNVSNNWILPNTGYKRNTLALSVNSKVTDKLTISSKVNYTNKVSDNLPGAGYGNQSIMYWYIFWQPSADMNWLKRYWVPGQEQRKIFFPFSTFPENPYAIAYEFINRSNRHNVTGNVQAAYNFTKELSLQVRASMDMSYERRAQERPFDAGSKLQAGSYRTQNIFSQEVSGDFLLKYAKKITDFDLSATFGGSALKNTYNKDEVRADSLITPGIYSMSNAARPLETFPYNSEYAINSFYGLLTGAYKNYLFLDITGRQDWNSTLATPDRKENAGFFYSSASMSFVASEIWKMPKQVDFAKLRLSIASVGGGTTTPYRTAYNYATAGSQYSGGLQNPNLLANPNLKPLRTTTYEAGFNVKMFKNRLNADAAFYTGNTKDQILERIIDRAGGYTRNVINAGKVNNRGIELSVGGTPVISRSSFKWSTSIVFSSNRNRIESLPDSSIVLKTGPVGGGQIVAKVGGSMGDLYGRGYVRAPDGQIVYDANTGFAKITEDVIYLGNTIPKGKLGFSNDFYFKGFHLNVLFDAQWGAVGHSLTHYKLAEQGKLTKTLPGRYNGIIGNGVVDDGTGKFVPNTKVATNVDEYYRSHWGIDNAEGSTFSTDFVKFREARLDYTLNKKWTQKIGLQKVVVGVYGRNLFIWSDWPAFDPEFGTLAGSDIVQGFEVGQFPSTRTIGFNLVVGL